MKNKENPSTNVFGETERREQVKHNMERMKPKAHAFQNSPRVIEWESISDGKIKIPSMDAPIKTMEIPVANTVMY